MVKEEQIHMALRITRKKLIIGIVVVIVLAVGGFTYAYFGGFLTPAAVKDTDNGATVTPETTAAKRTATVQQKQRAAEDLVANGDQQSIQEADQLLDEQIAAAEKSNDDSYSVQAYLAKASVLIDTSRAQEALDSVLLPLDKKYGTNDAYKYDIYGYISSAYRVLGNEAKSQEYFKKIPAKGWNE